jgi:hypothetical protein
VKPPGPTACAAALERSIRHGLPRSTGQSLYREGRCPGQVYLTQFIFLNNLRKSTPPKTVNLIFRLTIVNDKLTFWGGC